MEERIIYTRIILEMLGAPKNYIEETMKNYVAKIKTEGIKVKKEKYEEAKQQEKLFTTFAELEITFNSVTDLLEFCFEALPSSVEVLEPLSLQITAQDLTGFLNDLQARLHEADMIIKTSSARNKLLDANTTAVFHNFITHLVKQGPKTVDEISKTIGAGEKELQPFLKKLEESKRIKLEGTKYTAYD